MSMICVLLVQTECFPKDDDHAVTKLDKRHPTSSLPNGSSDISPSLTFESEQVLSSWTLFKVWSWKFTTSCSIPTKWYLWYNSASDSRLLASAIMFCQLISVWTSVSGTSTFAGRSSFDSNTGKEWRGAFNCCWGCVPSFS